MTAIHTLEMRYIGNTKERKGGRRTSYGWVDGEWKAIFSEKVLREWFHMPARPDVAGSLYSVLGVNDSATQERIKHQYRRLARQWHPDISKEIDATEQFQTIQHAYEILSNPTIRAKYDAGLVLERKAGWTEKLEEGEMPVFYFRPPLRCGMLLVEAHLHKWGKLIVDEILAWEDIYDGNGNALVTSWTYGNKTFTEIWVPTGS